MKTREVNLNGNTIPNHRGEMNKYVSIQQYVYTHYFYSEQIIQNSLKLKKKHHANMAICIMLYVIFLLVNILPIRRLYSHCTVYENQ